MNVFELIKEKLDKRITETYNEFVEGNWGAGVRCNAYHNAKEIVDEVAQKYAEHLEEIPIIHGKEELELHDKEVRSKVIDEFVTQIKDNLITDYSVFDNEDIRLFIDTVEDIAEQLKGGSDDR